MLTLCVAIVNVKDWCVKCYPGNQCDYLTREKYFCKTSFQVKVRKQGSNENMQEGRRQTVAPPPPPNFRTMGGLAPPK